MTREHWHSAIVVPCYNEQHRLDVASFREFAMQWPCVRLIMVDDGSSDATYEILSGLARSYPRQIVALGLPENQGKAEAVRTGLAHAMNLGVAYVGFLDADLAAPLDEFPRAIEVLERKHAINVVIGSRRKILGHRIERAATRGWLGRGFGRVASLVLGMRVVDTQCGLKVFRCIDSNRALFRQPFRSRWIFDVEMLARLVANEGVDAAKGQIYELPLERWREVPGSKLKTFDFAKALWELASIFVAYRLAAAVAREPEADVPVIIPFPEPQPQPEQATVRRAA